MSAQTEHELETERFNAARRKLAQAALELLLVWHEINDSEFAFGGEEYPFEQDFEDVVHQIGKWSLTPAVKE